jgi:hypothetical protein
VSNPRKAFASPARATTLRRMSGAPQDLPSPTSRAFWARRDGLLLAALLLVGSVVYAGYADYHGRRGGVAELDGYYYYVYLRSLRVDGDIDLTNDYQRWGNPFGFGRTATGRARNVFGIGPAIAWSPLFLLADGASAVGRALGSPLSSDPMSRFHQRITFFGSLLYGWLALLLCYLIVRRLFGARWALAGSLGAALAGPLPYYCLGGASYSHAPAAFATSLLIWCWLRHRDAPCRRSWLTVGAAAGFAMLVRPATAPFLLIPIWEAARQVVPALRRGALTDCARGLVDPLLAALLALLVFSPQIITWQLLYGTPLLVPQGSGFLLGDNAWLQTLFAPRNGLLPSAPLLALAFVGLALLLRREGATNASPGRALGLPLWLALIGLFLLNGAVHDWWGWNFSARRYTNALPLFAIGLTRFLDGAARRIEARPARTATLILGALIAAAALFNLEWLRQYTERNLKWYSVRSTRGLYLTVADGMVERVYDKLGNPLSVPAALAFSARRRGSPRVYDGIQGSYLLGEINPETLPAGKPFLHAMMPLSSSRFRLNLGDSFGGPRRDSRGVGYVPLRAERGHIFLPLNRPGKLSLWLRVQARYAGSALSLRFNGASLGSHALRPPGRWSTVMVRVPAAEVARGINRLELQLKLPAAWTARGALQVGRSGVRSPVDLAVASGGKGAGRFCDFWHRERRHGCARGINALVISPKTGALLGRRSFDAHVHPAAWDQLSRYLDHFPQGAIVALGSRDDVARHFHHRGAAALARIGAKTALARHADEGFAAIGVLGAPLGTALEQTARGQHARAQVGRQPPSWREAAWFSAIRLR